MARSELRNPFLIQLLRRMIKSEASLLFGSPNEENIIDYMALKRPFKNRMMSGIRRLRPAIDLTSWKDGRNLVKKMIYEKSFTYTQEKLDRVARCITFYKEIRSWDDFIRSFGELEEAKYGESLLAKEESDWEENEISDVNWYAFSVLRNEHRRLLQSALLKTGQMPKYFIDLGGHAIWEFAQRDEEQFELLKIRFQEDNMYGVPAELREILVLKTDATILLLLSPSNALAAGCMFMPCSPKLTFLSQTKFSLDRDLLPYFTSFQLATIIYKADGVNLNHKLFSELSKAAVSISMTLGNLNSENVTFEPEWIPFGLSQAFTNFGK